jgi:hypothetical protein
MDKKNKILFVTAFILSITFAVSFPILSQKNKRNVIKSSLINQKYESQITEFSIYSNNNDIKNGIVIFKQNECWFVKDINYTQQAIPCNVEKIKSFINNLIKVRNMYKISDSNTQNSSYGFSSSDTIHINYNIDGNLINEILFGSMDFSKTSRYIMPVSNLSIFEVDSSFEQYLNPSVSVWAEPYIISKVLSKNINPSDIQQLYIYNENKRMTAYDSKTPEFNTKIEKLFEFRHGGISYELIENKEPVFSLKTENGDGSSIKMDIYTAEENNYCVHLQYFPSLLNNDKTVYSSYVKISKWTFNSINELFN